MKETEKAYLAGLLDGEGSICIVSYTPKETGRPRVIPSVKIGMHSKAAVEFFAKATGKNMTHSKGSRGGWSCSLNYKDASDFLEEVLPYLLTKRPQALFFLFYYSITFNASYRGGGNRVPDEMVELRTTGANVLRMLNKFDDATFSGKADEFNERLSLEMSKFQDMITLSQASLGENFEEGATTREVSPNNNLPHERPPLIH